MTIHITPSKHDYLIPPLGPITIAKIQMDTCEKYGLTMFELLGDQRARRVSWPRQEAMWRCRRETMASLPMIARMFRKDHTTVMHAVRAHAKRVGANGAT